MTIYSLLSWHHFLSLSDNTVGFRIGQYRSGNLCVVEPQTCFNIPQRTKDVALVTVAITEHSLLKVFSSNRWFKSICDHRQHTVLLILKQNLGIGWQLLCAQTPSKKLLSFCSFILRPWVRCDFFLHLPSFFKWFYFISGGTCYWGTKIPRFFLLWERPGGSTASEYNCVLSFISKWSTWRVS
jgi:hypothetical protein